MGNARRRRSVSRICVSTSLMPTPGPPLREREGMMRRWRAAALTPPVFEPEAEAGVEGPACEAAGSVLEEGPPPLLLPLAAAVAAWPAVGVVEFAGAAAVATATTAGSANDADARLGMLPRRRRHKFFFSGVGVSVEKSGVLGLLGRGWASSPLWFRALPHYGTSSCSAPDDGERLKLLLPSLLSSIQPFEVKISPESQK